MIRNTIGYQNQFGGRRKQHPLSLSLLEHITGMSRKHVVQATKLAIDRNYIQCLESLGQTTVYSLKWLVRNEKSNVGSKRKPLGIDEFKKETSNGSITSEDQFKKATL